MTGHAALDPDLHRDLRVNASPSAELGDGVMACLTVPLEFRRIQNEFPILFRRDPETGDFSANALMGFEDEENLFFEDGDWDANYRPMALAIRPFLIGRSASGEGTPRVHIDMSHPRIATNGDGVAVFDETGRPTPYLEQIAAMLGDLHEGHQSSREFFKSLERHDLIEPLSVDVELNDGSKHRLVGYHIVNEERLAGLDPQAIGELHRAGHLMPVFMVLASLANLAKLARRKERRLQNG